MKTIDLKINIKKPILACGAHSKASFSFAKGNSVFLSEPFGNLEDPAALKDYIQEINLYKKRLHVNPQIIAYDMHPDYISTKYALANLNGKPGVPIQHHHAHIVSLMVDNNINEKVIGVAFDGTGFGVDGNLWGGEFFICDYKDFKRMGHIKYIQLIGAQQAIREPYRIAYAWLDKIYNGKLFNIKIDFTRYIRKKEIGILKRMKDANFNSPFTSSVGRLFDAVASLIGLCYEVEFEGEAAVALERIAAGASGLRPQAPCYKYKINKENKMFVINPELIFKWIISDLKKKIDKEDIALKFHNTIAEIIKEVCVKIRNTSRLNKVVLSGGVFQNKILLSLANDALKEEGFLVYTGNKVSCNDSGIALGQAVIANSKWLIANSNKG